jgi:hypothetical protein
VVASEQRPGALVLLGLFFFFLLFLGLGLASKVRIGGSGCTEWSSGDECGSGDASLLSLSILGLFLGPLLGLLNYSCSVSVSQLLRSKVIGTSKVL